MGRPRRQMRAGEIVVLVTRAARSRRHPMAVGAAAHVHRVRMTVVALPREVAGRMTVHTARIPQDRYEGGEQGAVSSRWSCSNGRSRGRIFRRADPARAWHRSYQDRNRATDSADWQPEWMLHTASIIRIGSVRIRFPVAANIALAIAGAVHGTPGSPIPPDFSLFSTMCVSIVGHSFMRI